jgi:signal transduction histidine kinase
VRITEVWPFLLPAVLTQLWMQVLTIAESLREKSQKPLHRTLYIASIAIFGLAAISFHLFRAERTPPQNTTYAEVERATHLTSKGIFFLLFIAYQVMGLHMLTEDIGTKDYPALLVLLTLSFLAMLLHNLIPENKRVIPEPILPMLQLLLCIPIQYMDTSGDNLFLVIIAGFSAINHASLSRARAYGIFALGAYILGSIAGILSSAGHADMSPLLRYFFVNTLVVLLALIAFYTLKKQMITSVKLESALNTVNEQAEQLKGLAVAEERNRMAADMHDTVGHTLTSAVLALEAAEALVATPEVKRKLHQGTEQVRRGLAELRASVRAERARPEADFHAALDQLLTEMRRDTALDIHVVVESEVVLPPLQAGILLSAVKECVTNAIRHGQATHADILMAEHRGQLGLAFTDNGTGSSLIQPGSGLSIMRERVEGIGGRMEAKSALGEGFTVNLTIPVGEKKGDVR